MAAEAAAGGFRLDAYPEVAQAQVPPAVFGSRGKRMGHVEPFAETRTAGEGSEEPTPLHTATPPVLWLLVTSTFSLASTGWVSGENVEMHAFNVPQNSSVAGSFQY